MNYVEWFLVAYGICILSIALYFVPKILCTRYRTSKLLKENKQLEESIRKLKGEGTNG